MRHFLRSRSGRSFSTLCPRVQPAQPPVLRQEQWNGGRLTKIAHFLWSQVVGEDDTVVDATCGKGRDTLTLAKLLGSKGSVHAFDVQECAIAATRAAMQRAAPNLADRHPSVHYHQMCHSRMREVLGAGPQAALVVFNLGYLPHGDRSIMTTAATTVAAVSGALEVLKDGGVVSILVYTKHDGGKLEYDALRGYLVTWIFLSAIVIMYNKYILSTLGFGYPISLTMFHMLFCATMAFGLVKSGAVAGVDINLGTYLRAVAPVGVLYAVVLWLSNATYMYLSVSFIQMLKAVTPATVYSVAVFMGTETWSLRVFGIMIVIVTGVAISAHGELNFVLVGVILQLVAIVLESFRLTLAQMLLQGRGIRFNPITTLYYVAPCCFVCLIPPFFLLEYGPLMADKSIQITPAIVLTNALSAFVLNCAIFLLLGKTSALTMNIGGVIKDWVLIALSVGIFKNAVTGLNLFGYSIAFVGVSIYNYMKIKEKQAAAAEAAAAPAPEQASLLTKTGQ